MKNENGRFDRATDCAFVFVSVLLVALFVGAMLSLACAAQVSQ